MNHVEGRNASLSLANPFLRPAFGVAPEASFPSAIDARPEAFDLEGVEDASAEAIEVKVMWGADVVRVAHVAAGASFTIGDSGCDFALPAEMVGASKLPFVTGQGGLLRVILPSGAMGRVSSKGEPPKSVADLVASGEAVPSRNHAGAHELELGKGSRARIELPGAHVAFELTSVKAGKRAPVGLLSTVDPKSHSYTGMSAFMHAALIASLAFFLPGMKGTDGETIDRDQADAMKPYLASIAERERDEQNEASEAEAEKDRSGGTGTAAKDEAGALGSQTAPVRDARYAIKGSADNTDPHIARERAVQEASTFGLVGIIMGSTENAPIAAWAAPDASGKDPRSANGGLWGQSIDDAFGMGGLSLTGAGEGGGGRGEGIGLGEIGGLGHGLGDGTGVGIGNGPGGIGRGHGVLPSTYVPKGLSMRPGDTVVNGGRIPKEVIQRIVRQNFGRFRLCYENALRSNPGLSGRVGVKFVIDRTGAVGVASDGGSDLPDRGVVSCVVRGFQNLSFPQPEGGVVTVNYPLVFTPGE
jgi:hypothetical protein